MVLSALFQDASFARGSDAYGKPAGFLRLDIPPNSERLASTPFIPFAPSFDACFVGQLTGAPEASDADQIAKWDATAQSYVAAFKADGTGDLGKDGKWFALGSKWIASPLTLLPGEGFYIFNNHAVAQQVFLCGQVVLDDCQPIAFPSGLTLFASPFSSGLTLEANHRFGSGRIVAPDLNWCQFDGDNDQWLDQDGHPTDAKLLSGIGYWFHRHAASTLVWRPTRPYDNPFANCGGAAPQITAMALSEAQDALTLSIACSGAPGETLEIFHQDINPGEDFNPGLGWNLSASGTNTNGASVVSWTDFSVANPHARVYLVARQDIDSDSDGRSDANELFVHGTNPNDRGNAGLLGKKRQDNTTQATALDTDKDGLSDTLEATHGTDAKNVNDPGILSVKIQSWL